MPDQPPGAGAGYPPVLRWPVELLYWDTPQVAFRPNRNVLITNNPLAAGLFYGARAAGNAAARSRARQQAQPQWLVAGAGEAVLDERGMVLNGTWGGTRASMRVDYAEVSSWQRDHDALRLTPVNYYPLLVRSGQIGELTDAYARLSHGKLWQPLGMEHWAMPPDVQIAGWEQRDKRFTCALPYGWEPLTDPGYLANVATDAAANQQRLLFMLRRNRPDCQASADFNEITSREVIRFLSADPGQLEQDALRFAGVKAHNAHGIVVNRPRVVLMDGERAVVIDTTMNLPHVHVRLCELYAGRRGHWFVVGFAVAHPADPGPAFDQLAPEFQAMIASWKWRF